ncbi:hypothetical protein [Belnapia rosea]|uniref:Uncharacterized protein n=1 Tax=Belnapia rosea TaxID=938405 RepID=A0A1G6WFE1_9PROT|nr:hypothetical protein [Belnapia rosea]SDD64582.1 hypothetical protein SAMN04487779_1010176 [Belnapia rosea]
MTGSHHPDVDFDKDYNVEIDVDFDTNVDVDVDINKDIDVDLDLCGLEGNAATLSLDVEAIGDNSLAEVVSTVIATDYMSSVTVEAGAFVN